LEAETAQVSEAKMSDEPDSELLEAVVRGMIRVMNDDILDARERKLTYDEVVNETRHGFVAMAKEAIRIVRESECPKRRKS
jgi:hypothetical protein